MNTVLICTGTELLKGSCCNTDLAFAGARLTEAGIPPMLEMTVGDRPGELAFALAAALKHADTVILSGGLGPTRDDITLETAARFFGLELAEVPELRTKVEICWAERHGGRCPKQQYKQARIPVGGRYFPNPAGVASGIGVDVTYAGVPRHVYLLPGPPGEFEAVLTAMLPELRTLAGRKTFTAGFLVCGMGETFVAKTVEPLLRTIPVEIAYTAQSGGTKLFLSGAETDVLPALETCRAALGRNALPTGEYSLPEHLVRVLAERGERCGCAESCTGGLVADALVGIPGASACFQGGIVAYANAVKHDLLRVPEEILRTCGAVSAPCAEAMALGACAALNCDCAVSTTGIAGPDGGTPEKPVGLVFVGAARHGLAAVRELRLHGSRRMIRERAAAQALLLLKDLLDGGGDNLC